MSAGENAGSVGAGSAPADGSVCGCDRTGRAGATTWGNLFSQESGRRILEKDLDEKMTWEDLARIAAAPEGLMKGTEHIRRRLVFLNKAEGKERIEAGKKIASYLQERKIGEVYLSSYGEEERA